MLASAVLSAVGAERALLNDYAGPVISRLAGLEASLDTLASELHTLQLEATTKKGSERNCIYGMANYELCMSNRKDEGDEIDFKIAMAQMQAAPKKKVRTGRVLPLPLAPHYRRRHHHHTLTTHSPA